MKIKTTDGFVDSSALEAACGSTYCTVSVLYDQSEKKNDFVRTSQGLAGEGAVTAGRPSNDTDLVVLKNIQAVSYARP